LTGDGGWRVSSTVIVQYIGELLAGKYGRPARSVSLK